MIREGQITAPIVVGQRHIPEDVRRLDTMVDPDYTDIFTATARATTQRPPEEWLRAMIEHGPRRIRGMLAAATVVQRYVLGLRAASGTVPGTMHGWRIGASGDDWVRLEASSKLLSGHVLLLRREGQVSCATFVHYERRLAAFVWPVVAVVHRRIARAMVAELARMG